MLAHLLLVLLSAASARAASEIFIESITPALAECGDTLTATFRCA